MRAVKMHEWQTEAERHRTVWTKTAAEAIRVLKNYGARIESAHLDFELSEEEHTDIRQSDCGFEVVRWFENITTDRLQSFLKCNFTVHTHNERAGKLMIKRLKFLGLNAHFIPFGTET